MREGSGGGNEGGEEKISPADCIDYIKTNSYDIVYSPSMNSFYLDSRDYHPGELEIELNDLERMLEFAKLHKK